MFIVYFKGSQLIISKHRCALVPDIFFFILVNSADPDEMSHHVGFPLGLKPFTVCQNSHE